VRPDQWLAGPAEQLDLLFHQPGDSVAGPAQVVARVKVPGLLGKGASHLGCKRKAEVGVNVDLVHAQLYRSCQVRFRHAARPFDVQAVVLALLDELRRYG